MFAYHIARKDFVGEEILPLNQLSIVSPELAAKAMEKYVGRSHTQKVVYDPETTINLDLGNEKLYWGDVSFYTIHHPQLFMDVFDQIGIPRKRGWEILKIPIERFSKRSFVWLYDSLRGEGFLPPEDCITIDQAMKIVDLTKIGDKTLEYFQECKDEGKTPRLYSQVPHLLSPDPVNISGVEIIQID